MTKLIHGIGINDADYKVTKEKNGKQVWCCPFYRKWKSMLMRVYCSKVHQKYPTYISVTVCKEWHTFSSFRAWMIQQDWEGKQLDKDLLLEGNKEYSPENCVFVDRVTNQFIVDCSAARGKFMIGVYWNKPACKFVSQCCNPFTKKSEHLGLFTSEIKAHIAWKKRKHEHALKLADLQTDERVAQALRTRYL